MIGRAKDDLLFLSPRRTRSVRIDSDITADRHYVLAGQASARITIVYQPVTPLHVIHKHHDMVIADRHRAWRW